MPANTPDQQITEPVGTDTADNPLAFNQSVADIEPKLVREYTTEADRTTRMVSLAGNQISSLSAPSVGTDRVEVYDGTNHVSLYSRAVYTIAYKGGSQNVGPSNIVLQDVTFLLVPLPGITGAVFQWEAVVYYNSGTTADLKFAYTMPAGATMRWGMIALATGAGSVTGDVNMASTTASGTAVNIGGAAADAMAVMHGEITMAATAGNLQLQAAQATSDASTSNILGRSRITAWRFQ